MNIIFTLGDGKRFTSTRRNQIKLRHFSRSILTRPHPFRKKPSVQKEMRSIGHRATIADRSHDRIV
mgnify:CR=1 FL=1